MSKSLLCSTAASIFIFASLPMISANHVRTNEMIIQKSSSSPIAYEAKDFTYLIKKVKGLDADLLTMHFTLYNGYVKNTNALLDTLKMMGQNNQAKSYEYGALKRRLGWEFDGMRLHEYYFSNMGPEQRDEESSLSKMIQDQFGDYDTWKNEYMATGTIRGIGWVILYYDLKDGRLINTWINEHDLGHLSGCVPLLVMDVWEHAYITQFGLDRAKYIETFFKNINWKEVQSRFDEVYRVPSNQKEAPQEIPSKKESPQTKTPSLTDSFETDVFETESTDVERDNI